MTPQLLISMEKKAFSALPGIQITPPRTVVTPSAGCFRYRGFIRNGNNNSLASCSPPSPLLTSLRNDNTVSSSVFFFFFRSVHDT